MAGTFEIVPVSTDIYARVNREHFKCNARDAINDYNGIWDIYEAKDKIPSETYQRLLKSCSQNISSRQKIYKLVTVLMDTESFENVLKLLDDVDLKTIADQICRPLDRQVSRIDLPHSRHLQTFYFHLKDNIDNGNFMDRREHLENKSTSIKSSFPRFQNENELAKAAGRYAVVTWLRIQHCNRNTELIRQVLHDMRNHWPNGNDKSLCDIFFHSKMAIADVMDGNIESAMQMHRTAKHLSLPFNDPLIKSLISHDSRYTHQRIFELYQSEENRRLILYESENGLDFLSSDYNGCDLFNKLVKRMFLLYIAQYFLKIQNDLNTEEYDKISDNDLENAKNVMFSFDMTLKPGDNPYQRIERIYLIHKANALSRRGEFQNSEDTLQHMQESNSQMNLDDLRCAESDIGMKDDIEKCTRKFQPETSIDPRRGMVYLVCRARICEKTGEYGMAAFLLSRALKLAQEGAHYTNEQRNIRKFIDRLIIRSN